MPCTLHFMFYLTSKHFTPHAQTFYTPHPTPEHFRTHTHFTPKYFAPRTLLPNTLHHTPKHFTPHTLQPNTVHLMPYTQTLYTPHLTPHTLHPNTVHLMPYTRTLYTSHPTPYTQSLHTLHLTPNHFTPHTLHPTILHPTSYSQTLHTLLPNKHITPHTDLFPFPASDPSPARQHLEPQPGHEGEGSLLAAGGEVAADEGLHAVGHALVGDAVVQL